jgi:acyl dehydratase
MEAGPWWSDAGSYRPRAPPFEFGDNPDAAASGAASFFPTVFKHYFEDFHPGWTFEQGARTLSAEDIKTFAREWDPQRYHTDEEQARASPYGGLIASGWQTACVGMRLMCDGYLNQSACVGSPGIEEIQFLKPVRPGDTLRFRSTATEVRPSKTKPNRGTVTFTWEVINQADEVVLSMIGTQLFLRRPAAVGTGT